MPNSSNGLSSPDSAFHCTAVPERNIGRTEIEIRDPECSEGASKVSEAHCRRTPNRVRPAVKGTQIELVPWYGSAAFF